MQTRHGRVIEREQATEELSRLAELHAVFTSLPSTGTPASLRPPRTPLGGGRERKRSDAGGGA